jgi:hypothetical protein
MFGRRKFAKQMRREEAEVKARAVEAARDAVSHVIAAFMTDPDVYAPKACILTRNPSPDGAPYHMFKLAWDDAILGEYQFEQDASLIVREVVEVRSDEGLADAVLPWLEPHDAAQVEFRALPGIFQEAFAVYWTGRMIPPTAISYVWVPSYGQPDQGEPLWVVRRFPGGFTGGPELGHLNYEVVPRELITGWFDERGW